jgi:ribosomal protein L37AE/L43A
MTEKQPPEPPVYVCPQKFCGKKEVRWVASEGAWACTACGNYDRNRNRRGEIWDDEEPV